MKANHKTTVTTAPAASHDIEGWRRRGDILNSIENPASTNTSTTGQRANCHAVTAVSLQPVAAPALSIAEPAMKVTNASKMSTPTVRASKAATAYLRIVARSLSMP